ncbi:DEAD/DEAH box helicase [Lactobacillus hominis]|uniref:DNA helicase n=1 Tax=Lactobacillus hominis DSM 23910 = CRBIP 24.179 TaxID=1423758 RepID=I7JV00_9LACO|nr:AAA domain-containing protein [Lactobacillus hominis]KRM85513.1 hypothetical protein FC41_GL000823 [Lactobacillus hominis DSM 23910 = CRBIP 24.179]MCT3347423.1 ATP-binding protein [Lactobacillus hominis]CCI81971.1 Putative uncharacterized protein [Lactobacillus hominis DSM 23910 = CRBIP 24.179]
MNNKNDILNSWILMEQLAEGNVNTSRRDKKAAKRFDSSRSAKYGFYQYFRWCVKQKVKDQKRDNPGIIFYLNTFKFKKILDIIIRKYNLEDLEVGFNKEQLKFSIAICFDKDMKLLEDKTFITMSSYILAQNDLIDNQDEFNKFESSIKNKIQELFSFQNNELSQENFELQFNQVFREVIDNFPSNIYWSIVGDIDTDDINLHSFFLDDLILAKKSESPHLIKYLEGISSNSRINLDPFKNINEFKTILQPKNYPLGHFLSKYPSSLMQQIAVNLVINEKNDIQTVNGPPGTGKTTLLKDIFAEFIIQQAKEICNLKNKNVSSLLNCKIEQTQLPAQLADKNIVVASSNNGAVRNIVDELPAIPDEKDSFTEIIEKIKSADYFCDLVHSKKQSNRWGVFSLEGGRKENMDRIISIIDQMIKELKDKNFVSDVKVYEEFMTQFNKLENKRKTLQEYANRLLQRKIWNKKIKKYNLKFGNEGEIISSDLDLKITHAKENIRLYQQKYDQLRAETEIKGGLFSRLFRRKREKNEDILKIKKINSDLETETKQKQYLENKLYDLKNESYLRSIDKAMTKEVKIPNYERDFSETENYEDFENEAYWYTSDDLKEESLLFILALRVRKQFLYENKESLSKALKNWEDQDKQVKENQNQITLFSWQWINFAIPVIGTTFASFHRMFRNLGTNSIPNLFIDEAGQAIPQSVIGALLRSKRIVAVGDPAQIKPVNSLDSKIISLIADRIYHVDEKYVSADTSVQTLMDQASKYGYYRGKGEWIGIPLWVHRRCLNPMFSISNKISYQDKMVLPTKVKESESKADKRAQKLGIAGSADWIDVSGPSDGNKFVEKQADELCRLIYRLVHGKDNPFNEKDIFVITPFKNVAQKLSKRLKVIDLGHGDPIKFTRYKDGKPTNIGTVHTFQGKENKVVFLVLGASKTEKNAAFWAVKEPNIINVAATRAKKWFYIIGDKELYKSLHSPSIDKTINIIDEYKKKIAENTKSNSEDSY